MAVRADPGHAVALAQPRGQALHRHDAAPGHEAGEGGARVAEQRFADARMHAIGADQRIAVHALAALQQQRHAVGILLEADAARADPHRAGRAFGQRLHQHGVEIATMHQPIGRAVACLGVGAEVLHAPGLAGVEQPHLLGDRHRGDRLHRRPQAECAQHARAVRRDLHAGAELAQFGRLFVQRDLEATLQQGQRGDDAADAGAGDQDAWLAQVPSPVRWRDQNRERRLDASGRIEMLDQPQSRTRRSCWRNCRCGCTTMPMR